MTEDQIKQDIMTKFTVPLWPHAGWAYGLSRNPTYEAAGRGDIPCITIGRTKRAPTAALRIHLGLEPKSAA